MTGGAHDCPDCTVRSERDMRLVALLGTRLRDATISRLATDDKQRWPDQRTVINIDSVQIESLSVDHSVSVVDLPGAVATSSTSPNSNASVALMNRSRSSIFSAINETDSIPHAFHNHSHQSLRTTGPCDAHRDY